MEECGRCDEPIQVDVQSIECEICKLWFHRTCVKLTKTDYNTLKSTKSELIHWFCKSCNKIACGLVEDIKVIKINQSKIQDDLKMLIDKVDDSVIDAKIRGAVKEAIPTSLSPDAGFLSSVEFRQLIHDEAREVAERDKRRSSVIVKGLGTDINKIPAALNEISQQISGFNVNLVDIVPVNGEMVRGKILNDEHRRNLLSSAKNLKGSAFSHVYINRDLTKRQRQLLSQSRSSRSDDATRLTGANTIPICPRHSVHPGTSVIASPEKTTLGHAPLEGVLPTTTYQHRPFHP